MQQCAQPAHSDRLKQACMLPNRSLQHVHAHAWPRASGCPVSFMQHDLPSMLGPQIGARIVQLSGRSM